MAMEMLIKKVGVDNVLFATEMFGAVNATDPATGRSFEDVPSFVACNINPDISGGAQPFTPSVGSEWWYPLWEKMVELDVPGTIHASATLNPAFHVTSSHYICQHHNAGVEILGSLVTAYSRRE